MSVVILATVMASGCAKPAGQLFDDNGPVWPPPPDPPRIRYLGSLATDADLRPAKTGWQAFTESLGGPREGHSVSTPTGVAAFNDRVYVTDPALHCVHIFDLNTREYAAITEAGDTPLVTPAAVAFGYENDIYVTDSSLHTVFKFSREGDFVRHFGRDQLKRPVGIVARMSLPFDGRPVNLSGSEKSGIFVVDTAEHAVVEFSQLGQESHRFATRGTAPSQLNYPTAIANAEGRGLLIADTLNFRVQCVSETGNYISSIGTQGDGAGAFALPKGIAVHYRTGNVYIVDAQFENVQVFDADGKLLLAFGREGHGPGEFWLPSGAAIDEKDRLFVADTYNRRVQVFQILPEGNP